MTITTLYIHKYVLKQTVFYFEEFLYFFLYCWTCMYFTIAPEGGETRILHDILEDQAQ